MARRRDERSPGSWLARVAALALLVAVGFGIGVVAGILWEAPRLVIAHLTGGTTEIAWTADSPGRTVAPVQAAPEGVAPSREDAPVVELPAVAAAPPKENRDASTGVKHHGGRASVRRTRWSTNRMPSEAIPFPGFVTERVPQPAAVAPRQHRDAADRVVRQGVPRSSGWPRIVA